MREIRIPLRRREHYKVWEGGQTKATTCNIAENKRNVLSHNICSTNIFDREQTSCNMIQQRATWYNNTQQGGQTVQTFSSREMLHVVAWKVGIVWLGLKYHLNKSSRLSERVSHCKGCEGLGKIAWGTREKFKGGSEDFHSRGRREVLIYFKLS